MSGYPQFMPGAAQQAPYGGQAPTIGGQADPQSQYLQRAMQAIGQQPMGNAAGLGSNLMAEALLRYAAQKRAGQQFQGPNDPIAFAKPFQLQQGPGMANVSNAMPDMSY